MIEFIRFIQHRNLFMKIFKTQQIKSIDNYTIKHEPISSIDLMERASATLFDIFHQKFTANKKKILIFVGPGNNGGDALVLARMLLVQDYTVQVFLLSQKLSVDGTINLQRFNKLYDSEVTVLEENKSLPIIHVDDVIVDGILGSGITREVDGFYAKVIQHLNQANATVFSIDIPSGLRGEENPKNDGKAIIKATITVSFQFPKLAFFFPDSAKYVGKWIITDIGLHPLAIKKESTPYHFISTEAIRDILQIRQPFSHKGNFGHALLLAGSYGKMGASILSAKAALKSGLGLLTVHVPHVGYSILQTSVPEAMVSIDRSEYLITEFPKIEQYNAVGIGPGIGTKTNTKEMLYNLLLECKQPMVIDADAINVLGEEKEWLNLIPENSILTPHPKEFERITQKVGSGYDRHLLQMEFAQKYKVVVVLKGAYTSVATPDGICCFNSTGNPGMATAGSGDVLTGIILGLLSQSYSPVEAAVLGVWLHGKAGDLCLKKDSFESLIASNIIEKMGKAYQFINVS